jgi:hypothetical protein
MQMMLYAVAVFFIDVLRTCLRDGQLCGFMKKADRHFSLAAGFFSRRPSMNVSDDSPMTHGRKDHRKQRSEYSQHFSEFHYEQPPCWSLPIRYTGRLFRFACPVCHFTRTR